MEQLTKMESYFFIQNQKPDKNGDAAPSPYIKDVGAPDLQKNSPERSAPISKEDNAKFRVVKNKSEKKPKGNNSSV